MLCLRHTTDRTTNSRRRGATVVEVAMVAPLTFMMLIGLMVGGAGTFRYQQISSLAQEGARWAAVRGPNYRDQTGLPLPNAEQVFQNAIKPMATSIDLDQLQYTVTRDPDNATVTVTLNYTWLPEAFGERMTMTSTVVAPITN